jgi:hypothetical protein
MALLDQQNNIIYWDEVNWQWLPFVSLRVVNSKEGIIELLIKEGYTLSSIANLGITEISLGCYLYNGKIYSRDGGSPLKNLTSLISLISGKSSKVINKKLKGMGLLSKEQIDSLLTRKDTIEFDGIVYKNFSDLAKDYGFNPSYLSRRLSRGSSLDKIIPYYSRYKVSDHLGNRYRDVEDMLRHWGISLNVYRKRKEKGWSLEEALTGKRKDK